MKRRDVLKAAVLAGGAAVGLAAGAARGATPQARMGAELAKKLPRWRGFNLLEKFNAGSNKPFVEADFEWMAEWGFDFVRLPMDYRCWTDRDDPYKLDQGVLGQVDQAVAFGRKHKVHVCLDLHRAPGYTVASPPEKLNLWADEEAQKQFAFQWGEFARRYKGIPSAEVSFDLVNEPNDKVTPAAYLQVAGRTAEAIRAADPDRLIICDGIAWGAVPVPELAALGVAQSTRGYQPFQLTHYKASWVGGNWDEPTWPLKIGNEVQDKEWIRAKYIKPWKDLEAKGVGVHVGEWGAFNKTPHAVVLGWMRDLLPLWKEAGWGWAMWNFRGPFGPLDSGRNDVTYEDFKGHKLDRKMLDLVRQF
jgi:endoglucanase